MNELGYGNTQNWGFAPGIRIKESKQTLYIDNGDFRYVFKNLTHSGEYHMFERHITVIARHILKILVILQIKQALTQEQAIQIAHNYSELHSNIYISQQTLELLYLNSNILKDFAAQRQSKENQGLLEDLIQCVDIQDLKYSEKDDLYKIYENWYNISSYQLQQQQQKQDDNATKQKTYVFPKRAEQQLKQFQNSFETRLKNYYTDRYDRREYVCLWDLSTKLQAKMPFTHEIFYQRFRADGIAYLRPYFRLPEYLGGTKQQGIAKRAPTQQESKVYCGFLNSSLMNALCMYDGELVIGPWFETQYDLAISDLDMAKEYVGNSEQGLAAGITETSNFMSRHCLTLIQKLKEDPQDEKVENNQRNSAKCAELSARSFMQGSEELVYCLVELSVINLIDVACGFGKQKFTFLSPHSLKQSKYNAFFEQVVLSLEGLRFIEQEMVFLKPGATVYGELSQYIIQIQDSQQFTDKMKQMCEKHQFHKFQTLNTHIFEGTTVKDTHFVCEK